MAFTATGVELLGFSNHYPGVFAERMLLTAGMCLPVPNGLDARHRVAHRARGRRGARGEQVGDDSPATVRSSSVRDRSDSR